MKWKVQHKITNFQSPITNEEIIDILLDNRGIKTKKQKKEFLKPTPPSSVSLKDVGLSKTSVDKMIRRIEKAKTVGEDVVVYGDYDTDGVCATAVLWETLYAAGLSVAPYIPSRFEEGYGLNKETIKNLKIKNKNLKLIITVDNGIVAHDAVDSCKQTRNRCDYYRSPLAPYKRS
jgi:single-stranded-DNA-specific exonuclease